MSDACRDCRGALGAAALAGFVGDDLALQAHLDGCAQCRAELADLTSVARRLALADPARLDDASTGAPTELANRVVARVDDARRRRRVRTRRRVTLIAAAVLAAVSIVSLIMVAQGSLTDDGVRVEFPASGPVTARATLRDRAAGTEVVLHVSGLRADEEYWLWLTGESGDRVAAGTFRGVNGRVTMTASIPLPDARRIWVTDERDAVVLDAPL